MRHLRPLAAAVAFLLAGVPPPAHGQSDPDGVEPVTLADGTQLWFVEMPGAPRAEGGDPAAIRAEQDAFRASASRRGVGMRERRVFRELWNGLSIAVHPRELDRLRTLPTVGALYPVMAVELPESEPVHEPALLTALSMTGADIVRGELGLTGAGVRVGVIDTGVDYDHPDLGGDGVARHESPMIPNARVVAGWDFVGDAFTGPDTPPNPDPLPDDCNGHGTHVAGIVGASGGVTGVAPGVSIGAYRVFGCTGTTTTDILIEAMERAFADGMQVVNLSIGSERQWPQYPTAAAASRLVRKGVVVCASIGNSGSIGLWGASAPAVGHDVIGVASFQNTFVHQSAISISPDDVAVGYTPGGGTPPPPPPPLAGTFPLARTGTAAAGDDACAPLASGALAGHVALVRRGACGSYVKALHAQGAGALAVVLYNHVDGTFVADLTPAPVGSPPITIPVITVSRGEGERIDERLAAGPVSVTFGATISEPNVTGGLIDGFSSFGPGADLTLKPDLGAPGGLIRSTVPIERGGYAGNSGTSMASPHVAGAVALLLEARPRTPARAVRDILQNSARPTLRNGRFEAVHRQGAGMLRIDDAVRATTRVRPGRLELGEVGPRPVTRTLTIENVGPVAVLVTLGHEDALATGPNTFAPTLVVGASAVSFSGNPLSIPAGRRTTVEVTLIPDPALPDRGLFGGYLTIGTDDGAPMLRVPFVGFKGDYQAIPALTPTPLTPPLPRLTRRVGGSFVAQPAGATFTLEGEDVPWIEYHLDHPVERLRWEILEAGSGRSLGRALDRRYVPRSTTVASFTRAGWEGTTLHGRHERALPEGTYVLKMSIQKALGDDRETSDWEEWTSPPITLAPGSTVRRGQRPPVVEAAGAAAAPTLEPAVPNPARGEAELRFTLPAPGPAMLEVFDVTGRRIARWSWTGLAGGAHAVRWDGRAADGARPVVGVVLYRLTAAGTTLVRKSVRLP